MSRPVDCRSRRRWLVGTHELRALRAPRIHLLDFTTVTYRGRFGPKNIRAVWVMNPQNQFAKTLEVWAGIRANKMFVEFTEDDSALFFNPQPKLFSFDFQKGAGPATIAPPSQPNFTSMTLSIQ